MNIAAVASSRRALWLVVGGILTLATAIGIGRFAFTPLMPLMMRDGTLTAVTGAAWAAAPPAGPPPGAPPAARPPRPPGRGPAAGPPPPPRRPGN